MTLVAEPSQVPKGRNARVLFWIALFNAASFVKKTNVSRRLNFCLFETFCEGSCNSSTSISIINLLLPTLSLTKQCTPQPPLLFLLLLTPLSSYHYPTNVVHAPQILRSATSLQLLLLLPMLPPPLILPLLLNWKITPTKVVHIPQALRASTTAITTSWMNEW